jgi:hypothetical protein
MLREAAAKDSISINQFIATAVAEKMSALLTEDYLEHRAKRGNATAFDRILKRVPDVPPVSGDERELHRVSRPRKSKTSVTRKRLQNRA